MVGLIYQSHRTNIRTEEGVEYLEEWDDRGIHLVTCLECGETLRDPNDIRIVEHSTTCGDLAFEWLDAVEVIDWDVFRDNWDDDWQDPELL